MVLISIIVPTFNERENLEEFVKRLFRSSGGFDLEVVVVDDDSRDGTGELADELAGKFNLQVIHRVGVRGLSSAVIDGFNTATGEVFGVMDADLSHPPEVLPKLVEKISEGFEVVFASRKVEGGGFDDWPIHRKIISFFATIMAKPLTDCTDPMSGFFLVRKEVIEGVSLSPLGFKIGLEILVKGMFSRYAEVGYTFKDRAKGESKLGFRQYFDYLHHLLRLYVFKLKLS